MILRHREHQIQLRVESVTETHYLLMGGFSVKRDDQEWECVEEGKDEGAA